MTDYKSLIEELKYGAEYGCDYDLIERATVAIEELSANVADKDHLIQEQTYEIQRLRADVKRRQEKMIELAKKLPKRGEWIDSKEIMRPDMCSACGCIYEADRFMDKIAWHYCPNCGAKMTEVQDEA